MEANSLFLAALKPENPGDTLTAEQQALINERKEGFEKAFLEAQGQDYFSQDGYRLVEAMFYFMNLLNRLGPKFYWESGGVLARAVESE